MARVEPNAHPCDEEEVEEVVTSKNLVRAPSGEDHDDSGSINNGSGSGYESNGGS
jgi:hypothetical protein